ncbi:hypothetical protein PGLA_23400 [Paenibacillus glacialis]|uniref:Uncharacterized protein n=1 Tax=Paenibacillus glacialis TaxID=494026 RepID=A0A168D4T0_9BACL|nr:hypothetical protein PGLA_23400 [Paenibacillus glacialis]
MNASATLVNYLSIVEYTGLSKYRIYQFLGINPEYGGIPCFRIGSTVLSKREEFLVWWDEQIKYGTRVYESHDPYNLGFKKPDKLRILMNRGYLVNLVSQIKDDVTEL